MSQKTIKIITTVVLVLLTLLVVAGNVFAATGGGVDVSQLTGEAPGNAGEIQKFGNRVVGVLQAVGVVISVVILIVLGIKYMIGSAEEKAEYKKTMIPYVVGAALIFAASIIAGIVINFFGTK